MRKSVLGSILVIFWVLLIICAGIRSGLTEQRLKSTPKRPNILLIVADDLGYSDLGAFGSEIHTPHLNDLAKHGVTFTNFHVAATCSTTRSMLLSGVDNHLNGLGGLDVNGRPISNGGPGYEGYLNFRVVAFSTLLRKSGYHTYMVGKWHLGNTVAVGPENRGFQQVFVMPGGAASHFGDKGVVSAAPKHVRYRENGKRIQVPKDFFSTRFYTNKMISYIDRNIKDGKPFFGYLAYTAPHWPLQAPEKYIDKYKGVYNAGYDAIREKRLARMKALGIFSGTETDYINPKARKWSSLTDKQKARETRLMEVYAGMVDALDTNIGRLIKHLSDIGQLNNTVVIFMSDNGPEGNDPYTIAQNETWVPKNFLTDTKDLGKPGSFDAYGPGWAAVSAAPFKLYKAFSAEGGLRVPAIVIGPGVTRVGVLSSEFATVLDVAPTILSLAHVRYPDSYFNGHKIPPLEGDSMLPYLSGKTRHIHGPDYVMGWELYDRRAIHEGHWKIVWINPPYGNGHWALYDMATDPTENHDLSKSDPIKLHQMILGWDHYVKKNGVRIFNYAHLKYSNLNYHYDHH